MTISFIIEHSAITGRKTSSKSSKREKERLLQNPARERERDFFKIQQEREREKDVFKIQQERETKYQAGRERRGQR